jgi:hypothetical protein
MPGVEPGNSKGHTLSENQRHNGDRRFCEKSGSTGIEDMADNPRYGGVSDHRSSHVARRRQFLRLNLEQYAPDAPKIAVPSCMRCSAAAGCLS